MRKFYNISLLILIAALTLCVGCQKKKEVIKDGVLTISSCEKYTKNHSGDKSIEKVIVKEGVKVIGPGIFSKCKNLKEVILPEGLEEIGEEAFCESGIENIIVPKTVTRIGEGAFQDCDNLTDITLPGNYELVVDMTSEILRGKKLKNVNFNTDFDISAATGIQSGMNLNVLESDPNFKSINGVIYSKDGKDLVRVPADRKELTVEDGCENFCLQALVYGSWFDEESIYTIAADKVESIALPKSVKNIDDKKYIDNRYNKDVNYLSNDSWYLEISLSKVKVENKNISTNSIRTLNKMARSVCGKNGMKLCESLKNEFSNRIIEANGIYVLDNDYVIGFKPNCKKKITIPNGAKIVDTKAFNMPNPEEQKYPKEIVFAPTIKTINSYGLANNQFKRVILNDGLEVIGQYAMANCSLKKLTIPESVKEIKDNGLNDAFIENMKFEGNPKLYNGFFMYTTLEFNKPENGFTRVFVNYGEVNKDQVEVAGEIVKVKGASGYEVTVATDKEFKKNVKVITTEKDSFEVKYKALEKTEAESEMVYCKARPFTVVRGKKIYGKYQ